MLSVPSELVGDDPALVDDILSNERDVASVDEAAALFHRYFEDRFSAALQTDHQQVVLLSGGIDSIVTLAALAHRLGAHGVEAVTVCGDRHGSDLAVAEKVASSLGVRHTVVTVSKDEAHDLASWAIRQIGVDEMWEVGAAIMLKTAFGALPTDQSTQVWSGDGGDELLAGGRRPGEKPGDGVLEVRPDLGEDATRWLAAFQRETWLSDWTSNRLVPDFFERVIPQQQLWRSMNTEEACRLAARLQAAAVWAENDKEPLRTLAEHLGVPRECARHAKAPMQVSSGLLATLLDAARDHVAGIPHSGIYRDTRTEPVEHNLVRLWLHLLGTGTP